MTQFIHLNNIAPCTELSRHGGPIGARVCAVHVTVGAGECRRMSMPSNPEQRCISQEVTCALALLYQAYCAEVVCIYVVARIERAPLG